MTYAALILVIVIQWLYIAKLRKHKRQSDAGLVNLAKGLKDSLL